MTRLHELSVGSPSARKGDIVFVHGLDGDWKETWCTDGKKTNFWPEWLAEDLPETAVWSLEYDAPFALWRPGNSMPLTDRGRNVLAALEASGIGDREVIFVTHSLGGLLVKQMLRIASDTIETKWKRLAKNCKGVVFFATPHTGSKLATVLRNLGSLLKLTVSANELESNSAQLRDLNEWFRVKATESGLAVQVYTEKQNTHSIRIVAEDSADPGIPSVVPVPLDANHVTISKFYLRDYFAYKRIRQFAVDCLSLPTSAANTTAPPSTRTVVAITPARSGPATIKRALPALKLKETTQQCFPDAAEDYPAGSRFEPKPDQFLFVLSKPSVAVRSAIEFMQRWHQHVIAGSPDCAVIVDLGPITNAYTGRVAVPSGDTVERLKWLSAELEPGRIYITKDAALACDRTMALFAKDSTRKTRGKAAVELYRTAYDDPRTVGDSALVHALFIAPPEATQARRRLFELFFIEYLLTLSGPGSPTLFNNWAKSAGYSIPPQAELLGILTASEYFETTAPNEFVLTKSAKEHIEASRSAFSWSRTSCCDEIRGTLEKASGAASAQIIDIGALVDKYLLAVFLEIRLLANYFKRGYELFESAPESFARFDHILTEQFPDDYQAVPIQTWRQAFLVGLHKAAKNNNAYIAATFHNVLATYYLNRHSSVSPYQTKRLENRTVYIDTNVLYALRVAASNYHEIIVDLIKRLTQLGVTIKVFPFTVDEYEYSLHLVLQHCPSGKPDDVLTRWNPWLFQEFRLRAGKYMNDIRICREVHQINRRALICEPEHYDEVDRVLAPIGLKLEREFLVLADEEVESLWTEYSHKMPSNAWPLDEYWEFLHKVAAVPLAKKRHDIQALVNVGNLVRSNERDEVGPRTVFLTLDSNRLLRLRRILRYIVSTEQLLDFFLPYLFLNDIPLVEAESFPNRLLSAQLGTLLVQRPPQLVDIIRAFVEDASILDEPGGAVKMADVEAVAAAVNNQRFGSVVAASRTMPEAERQNVYSQIGAAMEEIKHAETTAYFEHRLKLEIEIQNLKKALQENRDQLLIEVQKRQKAEGKEKYVRSQRRRRRN